MKGTIVFLLILVSVCISTFLFHQKWKNSPDKIDELTAVLDSMMPYVHPGSHIYINKEDVDAETYLQLRYILAPSYISNGNSDTALSIIPINDTPLPLLKDEKVIWQGTSRSDHYILSVRL